MTRFALEALKTEVNAAVEAEGLRPFARRAKVSVGVVRSLLDSRDLHFSTVVNLLETLGHRLYFGPPGASVSALPDALGDDFHLVPLHEAELSAGPGAVGVDGVIEMLAFRRDWLDRLDIAPGNAALARIRGDSMEPLLRHGDVVMIDRGRRDVPARPSPSSWKRSQRPDASLYAVRRGTDCLVKRVERTDWKGVVLLSENWAGNPPEFVPESEFETGYAAILGQVRWWAHSVAR